MRQCCFLQWSLLTKQQCMQVEQEPERSHTWISYFVENRMASFWSPFRGEHGHLELRGWRALIGVGHNLPADVRVCYYKRAHGHPASYDPSAFHTRKGTINAWSYIGGNNKQHNSTIANLRQRSSSQPFYYCLQWCQNPEKFNCSTAQKCIYIVNLASQVPNLTLNLILPRTLREAEYIKSCSSDVYTVYREAHSMQVAMLGLWGNWHGPWQLPHFLMWPGVLHPGPGAAQQDKKEN